MIWAKEETLSREEIERIQTERLVKLVHYVYDNVEPYRKKMDDAGIKPDDIKTLDDLKRLPFTTKQDFRDNYPFGLFAVDKSKLARIHASSGTTGKPTDTPRRILRHGLNVWQGLPLRAAHRQTMYVRYASATVCSREHSDCTRDLKESVRA